MITELTNAKPVIVCLALRVFPAEWDIVRNRMGVELERIRSKDSVCAYIKPDLNMGWMLTSEMKDHWFMIEHSKWKIVINGIDDYTVNCY